MNTIITAIMTFMFVSFWMMAVVRMSVTVVKMVMRMVGTMMALASFGRNRQRKNQTKQNRQKDIFACFAFSIRFHGKPPFYG